MYHLIINCDYTKEIQQRARYFAESIFLFIFEANLSAGINFPTNQISFCCVVILLLPL